MNRLFAISDIHGCFKPFFELVTKTIDLKKSDELVLLGDYIDRGERSKDVVDFIIDLRKEGYDVTTLMGNHEVMLIDSYNKPEVYPNWLMNGGNTTLDSFGIMDVLDIGNDYLGFFSNLEYYKIKKRIIFVHAGFDDFAADPFEDSYKMVWECRYAYQNPLLAGKTIIHGHRPKTLTTVKTILNNNCQVIPIDTGCVYSRDMGYGLLSALEVNSMTLYSVANE
jgi:serine/threonine protein phosphatase 1